MPAHPIPLPVPSAAVLSKRGQHLLAKLPCISRRFAHRGTVSRSPYPLRRKAPTPIDDCVGRTFQLRATVLTGFPSRHPKTILARSTNRALSAVCAPNLLKPGTFFFANIPVPALMLFFGKVPPFANHIT